MEANYFFFLLMLGLLLFGEGGVACYGSFVYDLKIALMLKDRQHLILTDMVSSVKLKSFNNNKLR